MRTKKVTRTRAWCDFCKKGMWSVAKIEVHEKHCTMNPNRVCRVCKTLLKQESTPLPELIALCKASGATCGDNGGWTVPDSLHINLRHAAQQCPACEMAALRQSGIPCGSVNGFDFTKEIESIWVEVNQDNINANSYDY